MARSLALTELASMLGVLAHADRIRIVEELRAGERDVNTLAEALETGQARVSQHLALLRAHKLVATRRDGRRVLYHLTRPAVAGWLIEGLDFLQAEVEAGELLADAVARARVRFGD